MTNGIVIPTIDYRKDVLPRLGFRAEANPLGKAIDLVWQIPVDPPVTNKSPELDDIPLLMRRRQGRFPGLNRRGVVVERAQSSDLSDGKLIYDSPNFQFDFEETQEDRQDNHLIITTRQYGYQGDPRDRVLLRSILQDWIISTTGGEPILTKMTIRLVDRDELDPQTVYYYTAFVGPENERYFSRLTQDSAMATGRYGHGLFSALPQIHQQFDTVKPEPNTVARADQHKGQLQRLLEVFEAHADLLHSVIEGGRDLHNIDRVDSRFLPHLAHLIGWRLKANQNEMEQRTELRFAPEIYQTTGTISNIQAIIKLLTGWDSEVREFSRNVLVSFDSSRLEQWNDSKVVYLDGNQKPLPVGSVDTSDPVAMSKLRNHATDDQTAYSYHVPPSNEPRNQPPKADAFYNLKTVGIYIPRDAGFEGFSSQGAINRLYQVLREFLPIQVRPIFFIQILDIEDSYNATAEASDELTASVGLLSHTEIYSGGVDEIIDYIPGWHVLMANNPDQETSDPRFRTWHSALNQDIPIPDELREEDD